jgi:hypothetical protein
MKTVIKLLICLFILVSFTACFPVFMTREHRGEGRWYYNNHQYESGRDYRQARHQGRYGDKRSGDNNKDNRGNYNNGNQRDNR